MKTHKTVTASGAIATSGRCYSIHVGATTAAIVKLRNGGAITDPVIATLYVPTLASDEYLFDGIGVNGLYVELVSGTGFITVVYT